MRSSVLRIFPPDHKNVNAAFYALILFVTYASAQARPVISPALKIQTQNARPQRARTPANAQKKRGLSPLQNDEAPEGSRVTITYNEPLSDYSAYRRGDQFVVVIPKSDAPRIRNGLRGRGFEGVQVEKRGDDTVLSFRIQPGVKARVDQQHNRLEVIFSKPGQAAATVTPSPQQPTVTATPAKTPQGAQTAVGLPSQTPLADQNSANANQQKATGAGADSTTDSTASTAQTGGAPADSTLPPSTEGSTSQAQPSTVTPTTEAAPAASPRTTFAALKMLATRQWLPLLIALLLLASAYLSLRARRRGALKAEATVERARLTEEIEGDTAIAAAQASRSNNGAAETARAEEESAPTHQATELEVTAAAATTADSLPHETVVEVSENASGAVATDASTVEHRMDAETGAGKALTISEAPAISVEATNVEAQQDLWVDTIETLDATTESDQEEVQGAEIETETEEAFLNKEPVLLDELDEAPLLALEANSNGSASTASESERAASVLRLSALGSDEAFLKIGAAFDDPSQQVRDAAARSLFNFSADRVASFKRIMQESSKERRRKIGAAIVSSGMATEAISDLTGASGEKAYDALLVLSLMAKAGEVQSLVNTIEEHPSTEVRLALVKLLALSGQPEVVSAFRYLSTRDQLPIAVRSSIMEAIYQINNPRPFDLS